MKRLALALLCAALLLTGCASKDAGTSGVTLSVMGKRTDLEKPYMTSIFRQYEQATGNALKLIAYEDAEFETAAARDFAAGNVPDIFLHFHNADLKLFDVEANFCDLSGERWTEDLTDSADAYCRDEEGRLLGLPFWESSVSGCYYNRTILDSLGLKPASTQAEFDELCQVLCDIGIVPICWPGDGCSWMVQFGLDPIFADDPSLLARLNANALGFADIPAVTDMVRWLSDAAQRGWFGEDYLHTDWDGISEAMSSGEAVMTFIWDTWFYTDFQPGKYTVDDFALMPVFMNTADGGTYEGGNLNMMMVNKNGERREEALEFLDFCAMPEHYNEAFNGIATVNCFRGQTTNIKSSMVTQAEASIAANERVSTASTRIIGYDAQDMISALDSLFRQRIDVAGCVKRMDEARVANAQKQGAAGF